MMSPSTAVKRYLCKNSIAGPWTLSGSEGDRFRGAVVIPSIAEGESLFKTLQSLSDNSPDISGRFLVVVVVNHGEEAPPETVLQNQQDLAGLSDCAHDSGLALAWVDAASSGLEVPAKQAGVGFARKLGLDRALQRLDWSCDPVLVCLDADTLVDNNYFAAIDRHFLTAQCGAAVLPFRHQPAQDPQQQEAIDRYELFIRSYVFGLRLAGSPYAFNSVGSAMACRAAAYIRCGGMNTRKAGEDFYFLQKLAKTDGVEPLCGTTVYPEPRISQRVPFGTGRSMERLMAGDSQGVLFYPVEVFKILSAWLNLVAKDSSLDAESLLSAAQKISPVLAEYLEQAGWVKSWPVIQRTHQKEAALIRAFHVWFDGFKTLRLIHLLCEEDFRRDEPKALLPAYFAWLKQSFPGDLAEVLAALRLNDGA